MWETHENEAGLPRANEGVGGGGGTSDCMPSAELRRFRVPPDFQRWSVGTNVGVQKAPLLREHHVRRGLQKSTGLKIIGHRKGKFHAIQGRLEERDRVMCSYLGRGGTSNRRRAGVIMRKWWADFGGRQYHLRNVARTSVRLPRSLALLGPPG